MNIELTTEDKLFLKHTHKKTKDGKERDKIKFILLLSDGYSCEQISSILLIDEDTVRNWYGKYTTVGENFTDWLANEYKGYRGKLTAKQEQQIIEYVSANIISDSKQIIRFIKDEFDKYYSLSGVVDLLNRLGFTYKKTTLIPSKYDAEKQANFKEQYEKLIEKLEDNEVVAFMDGVHPQHNTTCTNAWIKKGTNLEIKSNTGRSRININGIYNPLNQDVLIHESKTINAEYTIEFLEKIAEFYKDKNKIWIIVDNAKYYRNKYVRKYLETSKIKLIFLPAYSPNLNLIERLWKLFRKTVINNKYYASFKEFRDEVLTFFDNCKNEKDAIRKFIGSKLHLLTKH